MCLPRMLWYWPTITITTIQSVFYQYNGAEELPEATSVFIHSLFLAASSQKLSSHAAGPLQNITPIMAHLKDSRILFIFPATRTFAPKVSFLSCVHFYADGSPPLLPGTTPSIMFFSSYCDAKIKIPQFSKRDSIYRQIFTLFRSCRRPYFMFLNN